MKHDIYVSTKETIGWVSLLPRLADDSRNGTYVFPVGDLVISLNDRGSFREGTPAMKFLSPRYGIVWVTDYAVERYFTRLG